MSDKQQTPSTNNNARRSLVLIIAIIIAGTGWFVWQATKDTDKVLENTNKAQSDKTADKAKTSDEYKGWKTFDWTSQGLSFKHPGDWVTSEAVSMGRVYAKNSSVDLLKEETPDNFQQIWLSVDTDETAKTREDAIKAGNSDFRMVTGAVKASTIKSGDLTINVYEYATVGGATLEAYWTGKDGKRYFATNSTEVGEQNQKDMVATLKKVLATVKFAQ